MNCDKNLKFMRKFFEEKATTQAAILLLEKHSNRMPYIKLIKLLYLADRISLLETGASISKDAYFSMHYGPILSVTLDMIRKTGNSSPFGRYWWKHIETDLDKKEVFLRKSCDFMELTEKQEEILNRVFEEHGQDDRWDLVEWTHKNIPEWEEVEKGSRKPIEFETLFEKANHNPEEAEDYRNRLKYYSSMAETLNA